MAAPELRGFLQLDIIEQGQEGAERRAGEIAGGDLIFDAVDEIGELARDEEAGCFANAKLVVVPFTRDPAGPVEAARVVTHARRLAIELPGERIERDRLIGRHQRGDQRAVVVVQCFPGVADRAGIGEGAVELPDLTGLVAGGDRHLPGGGDAVQIN
jgi:hypothetical protein